jgi:HK97 family phage prohead protease
MGNRLRFQKTVTHIRLDPFSRFILLPMLRKLHTAETAGLEFVLSDETPDRHGDIILAAGWDYADFSRNPIALWNHRGDFPLGKWSRLRVEGKALRGHLELAPEGTSSRIDEIRRLVEAGILKSVSVGFQPIESRPREDKSGGVLFVKQSLVETSLVSVPSNPNALAVAKSLGISADTRALVFADRPKPHAPIVRSKQPSAAEVRIAALTKEQAQLMRRLLRNVDLLAGARELVDVFAETGQFQELTGALKQVRAHESTIRAVSHVLGAIENQLWDAEAEVMRLRRARASVVKGRHK